MANAIKYNNFTLKFENDNEFGAKYTLVNEGGLEINIITNENRLIINYGAKTLEENEAANKYVYERIEEIQEAIYKWNVLNTIYNYRKRNNLEIESDLYKKSISELIDITRTFIDYKALEEALRKI